MSVQAIDSIRRILDIFVASEAPIRPHFILTGPSVSGESHTIQALTPLLHQYFIEGGIKEKSTKKVTFQKTLSL